MKFDTYKVCGFTPDWSDIPLWGPLKFWWLYPQKMSLVRAFKFMRDILRVRKTWNATIDAGQNAYPHRRFPFLLKI